MSQPNPRGAVTKTIGDLEITLLPTFTRISRAEQALKKSCMKILDDMGTGDSLSMLELAVFFESLSKPKLKRDVIGDALMGTGYKQGMELLAEVLNKVLVGDDDDPGDPDETDDLTLPGEGDKKTGKPKD